MNRCNYLRCIYLQLASNFLFGAKTFSKPPALRHNELRPPAAICSPQPILSVAATRSRPSGNPSALSKHSQSSTPFAIWGEMCFGLANHIWKAKLGLRLSQKCVHLHLQSARIQPAIVSFTHSGVLSSPRLEPKPLSRAPRGPGVSPGPRRMRATSPSKPNLDKALSGERSSAWCRRIVSSLAHCRHSNRACRAGERGVGLLSSHGCGTFLPMTVIKPSKTRPLSVVTQKAISYPLQRRPGGPRNRGYTGSTSQRCGSGGEAAGASVAAETTNRPVGAAYVISPPRTGLPQMTSSPAATTP